MPRSMAREQDALKTQAERRSTKSTSRRIGIHTSIAGGVENAAERAYRLGCNTLQIFSSSPRQWAAYELGRPQCEQMKRLRDQYDLKPLVIHTNYLVNLASTTEAFLKKSIQAFRGEIERALALCAEYLVLHPGSFRGADREKGLLQTAAAIAVASRGLELVNGGLTILIENTAGAEFSLGASFEQVAGKLDATIGLKNVPVWHCNDAKAARGSKLDRHQHIGQGSIGPEPFRWLLKDSRLAHAAFIAETPIDNPGDDRRNVDALKKLAK